MHDVRKDDPGHATVMQRHTGNGRLSGHVGDAPTAPTTRTTTPPRRKNNTNRRQRGAELEPVTNRRGGQESWSGRSRADDSATGAQQVRKNTVTTDSGSARIGRGGPHGPGLDMTTRTAVGVTGFEPATLRSQSGCATKLRYTPWSSWRYRPPQRMIDPGVERVTGIEPAPSAWKAEVLPLNYTRRHTTSMGSPRCRVRTDCTERPFGNANQRVTPCGDHAARPAARCHSTPFVVPSARRSATSQRTKLMCNARA
jgi:hypothetical protein